MRINILSIFLFIFCIAAPFKINAQEADRLFALSKELMRTGNYQEALISMDKALAFDTSKADYFVQKAMLCYHLNQYKEALRLCYSAHRIEPDKPQVHYLRGLLCLATESYGGAIFFFGKVISSGNEEYLYKAYLNRGKTYLNTGKVDEAVNDLSAANKINPDSIEAPLLLAEAYCKLNQPDKALPQIEKVIRANPKFTQAQKILGNIYFQQKDFPKALEALNTYTTTNIGDAEAYQTITNLYIQNKDFEKARTAIGRAIQCDPKEPLNFKILAIICIETGKNEEGCNNMFKAFQLGYLEKYGYDALDVYLGKCEGK
jgi:tetratricopeptide (TPR) repeat protein